MLLNLPDEIVLDVLHSLDYLTLQSVRVVCHRLHQLASAPECSEPPAVIIPPHIIFSEGEFFDVAGTPYIWLDTQIYVEEYEESLRRTR
jgi:hypothetical protein